MAKDKKIICTCCGKNQTLNSFYQSQSFLYKYYKVLPICKSCIDDIYNNYKKQFKEDILVIYNLCRLFDMPFSESAFIGAVQHSEKTNWKLYQSYFKQINSFNDANNYGSCFNDGENLYTSNNISGDSNKNIDYFKITPEIISFWGSGFTNEEYEYLEKFYTEFVNNYECDSPAQVLLFKNAAKTQLNADKALANNNINLYDKLMKTLSTILGDSNIKPVQETGANATDQVTFGTLVKKWENEKPIPNPLPDWKEKDILEYVKIWILGHLSKMLNLNNPFVREYEKEIDKYKVEMFYDENGD